VSVNSLGINVLVTGTTGFDRADPGSDRGVVPLTTTQSTAR